MPLLNNETRLLTFNSTKDISATCSHFESIAGSSNIVKGDLTCLYPSTTAVPSHNHGAVIGGATGGTVALVVLLVGLLVGGYFFRMRRNARRNVIKDDYNYASSAEEIREVPKRG